MLDLKFVKENREAVEKNIRSRNMNVDLDRIMDLYDKRSSLIQQTEELRQKRNGNAKKMKGKISLRNVPSLSKRERNLKAASENWRLNLKRLRGNCSPKQEGSPTWLIRMPRWERRKRITWK